MDQLLAEFQGSFSVAVDPNDPTKPHPRFSQYKFKREGYADQETRRKRMLDEQRTRRRDFSDYARKIIEGETSDDEMEEGAYDEVDGDTSMDSSCTPQQKSSRDKCRTSYKNQLMLSEWLVDVPLDFENNWYMIICPVAKRCLVVSHKGKTLAYSRSGHYMKQFPSHLPGGCWKRKFTMHDYCILDCLYHEGLQTFFVMDIMCWGGHPVYDSDTEFRFYWLNAKLSEVGDEVLIQAKTNPYKFVPLQYHDCTKDNLQGVLSSKYPIEVDGLIFFHKQAHYFRGRSPLVLWLKPHMVSEILSISVSQAFLDCAPVLSDVKMETEKGKGVRKTTENMETEKVISDNDLESTEVDNDMVES